jgi:hypothetical protein
MSPAGAESVISCAEDHVVQPWQAEPYRLWSLLEMLIFSANAFLWGARALRTIRGDCLAGSAIVADNQPAFFPGKDLDNRARDKALKLLPDVEAGFRKLGLRITADTVKDVIDELGTDTRYSFDWLSTQTETIEQLSAKELKDRLFLYVPPERAVFWPTVTTPNMFGDVVADAFSNANRDIAAAGRCLALDESTACIFHLMRVLEYGLRDLAGRVGLPTEAMAHENWKNVIDQIEKKIRELETMPKGPIKTETLKEYSAAAVQFRYFKDAWRNHVSHSRDSYDLREADSVYVHVREFMQHMAATV